MTRTMRLLLVTLITLAAPALADEKKKSLTTWLTVVDADRLPAAKVRVGFKCRAGEGEGFTSDTGTFEIHSGHRGPCFFVFTEREDKSPQQTLTLDQPRPSQPVVLRWKVAPPQPLPPLCLGVLVGTSDCTIVATGGALPPLPCAEVEARFREIARAFPSERRLAISCVSCGSETLRDVERIARTAGFDRIVIGKATTPAEVRDRCEAYTSRFPVTATETDALALVRTCTVLGNVPNDLRASLFEKDCRATAVCARGLAANTPARPRLVMAVESLDLSTELGRAAKETCAPYLEWSRLSP